MRPGVMRLLDELAVIRHLPDERMLFQEGQLSRRSVVEQCAQIAQTPGAVVNGLPAGCFQFGHGMFFGQRQKPVQNADGQRTALLEHLLGPGAGVWADEPGAIHRVSRNASPTEPATLLAIYLAPRGATAADLMKPI